MNNRAHPLNGRLEIIHSFIHSFQPGGRLNAQHLLQIELGMTRDVASILRSRFQAQATLLSGVTGLFES